MWGHLQTMWSLPLVDKHGHFGNPPLCPCRFFNDNHIRSYVSKGQARRFMQLLDKNSDGVLTLEEFSKAIARRAKGTIPIEHDLGEIVSAEFVALALRWMGLLPTQRRESKRLLLSSLAVSIHVPQSPIKGGQQLKPDTLSTVEHFTPASFSSAQVSPPLVLAGAELGTEHMVAVSIREEA